MRTREQIQNDIKCYNSNIDKYAYIMNNFIANREEAMKELEELDKIKEIKIGDVFSVNGSNTVKIVLVRMNDGKWLFGGNGFIEDYLHSSGFSLYVNSAMTTDEVISYLNKNNCKFIKNINVFV